MKITVIGDGEMTTYSGISGLKQLTLRMLVISVMELAEKESETIVPEKLLEIYHESIPGFFKALNEGTNILEYAQMIVSKAKEASLHKPVEK